MGDKKEKLEDKKLTDLTVKDVDRFCAKVLKGVVVIIIILIGLYVCLTIFT